MCWSSIWIWMEKGNRSGSRGARAWCGNKRRPPQKASVTKSKALRFAGTGFGRLETIANPWFGQNETRMRGVRFNLFSQLIDHHTKIFGFFPIVGSPNCLQQAAMRQRLALIGDQELHDFKFFRSEMHLLSTNFHAAAFEVDG